MNKTLHFHGASGEAPRWYTAPSMVKNKGVWDPSEREELHCYAHRISRTSKKSLQLRQQPLWTDNATHHLLTLTQPSSLAPIHQQAMRLWLGIENTIPTGHQNTVNPQLKKIEVATTQFPWSKRQVDTKNQIRGRMAFNGAIPTNT